MADQGSWFKLWCSALSDDDLDNLNIADFGRWAKLGAYIKQHGTEGKVTISSPARSLCAMFQVETFALFHSALLRLPNVSVEQEKSDVANETTLTVSFCNWPKYQGDFGTNRVRKFREMKRLRREENRTEENISKNTDSAPSDSLKKSSAPDPSRLGKPIEVQLYESIAKKPPPVVNYPRIVDALKGKSHAEVASYYEEWCSRGYAPFGLGWLEWVKKSEIPPRGRASPHARNGSAVDVAKRMLRESEEENGDEERNYAMSHHAKRGFS